ncbi:nucleolar protein dao-5-like isoform X2 [Sabethes cyaneus]|uniref:nucleolar protein dao-5-like isoform X2 n=1 Tax=Sabethes cyaneus TaxID=53552 RepID=UPI00237DEE59|nr:nucleolar protein dao-5-like isoform X2 [Sabethes cyaneus]
MADNVRAPIRLSDIDNLLEDSIFDTTNGARLVEYMKTRRTGGRMRLQNIFEQVAAQVRRPRFNLRANTSDPEPLPDSPIQSESPNEPEAPNEPGASNEPLSPNDDAVAGPSSPPGAAPVVNPESNDRNAAEQQNEPEPTEQTDIPVKDSKVGRKVPVKSPVVSLAREAMINQYHRTNAAKCNLLKQVTTSTPKVDTNGELSKISTFTTSISPIVESDDSPESQPRECVPASQPLASSPIPVNVPENKRCNSPIVQQLLAPCSQPVTTAQLATPQKVIVVRTDEAETNVQLAPELENQQANDMVIPETPSPAKMLDESPRLPHPPIHPRRLTATFIEMENGFHPDAENNDVMTSDESESINVSNDVDKPDVAPVLNVSIPKSILKDADVSLRKRSSLRVSFSQRLVEQREISPAPSIPEAHYSSCSDDSNESDIDEDEFEVVDEVYSDDSAEYGAGVDEYDDVDHIGRNINKNYVAISEQPGSPLLNVVDEEPGRHWFGAATPREDNEERLQLSPTTIRKYDKTNLQLVDIITDWDDEVDDDDDTEVESEKSIDEIPETQKAANTTNLEAMEITSSNMEEDAVRLIDLPSPPKPVQSPAKQDGESDLPLSPPPQFTDSAKKRFAEANDEAVLNRLQSELTSVQSPTHATEQGELKDGSYEKIPESLVEIAQSFRDPVPSDKTAAAAVTDTYRKPNKPPKKKGRKANTADPATETYFKTVQETFARPLSPSTSSVNTTKRKLYLAKPLSEKLTSPLTSPGKATHNENAYSLHDLRVVVQKLCLPAVEKSNDLEKVNNRENEMETVDKENPVEETENQPEKLLTMDTDESEAIEMNDANKDAENSKPKRINGITRKTRYKTKEKGNEEKQMDEQIVQPNDEQTEATEEKSPKRKGKRTRQLNSPPEPTAVESPEPVKPTNAETADTDTDAEPSSPVAAKASTRSRTHKPTEPDSPSHDTGNIERQNSPETAGSKLTSKPSKRGRPRKKAVPLGATPEEKSPHAEELASTEVQQESGLAQGFAAEATPSSTATFDTCATGDTVSEDASSAVGDQSGEPAIEQDSAASNGDGEERDLNDNGERVRTSEDEEFAGFEIVTAPQPEKKQPISRKKKTRNPQVELAEPESGVPVVVIEEMPHSKDLETKKPTRSSPTRSRGRPRKQAQSPPSPVESPVPEREEETASQLPLKKRKIRDNSLEDADVNASRETSSPGLTVGGEEGDDAVASKPKTISRHRSAKNDARQENKKKVDLEKKQQKPRPMSRFLRDYDDDLDKTWVPSGTKMLKEKTNSLRRHLDRSKQGSDSLESEQPVRRSKRDCRIASPILLTNPLIKSATQKPNYLPITLEQMLEAEHLAREIARKEKQNYRKPRAAPTKQPVPASVAANDAESRKRTQHQPPENQTHAKKTRVQESSDENATAAVTQLVRDNVAENKDVHAWMTKLINGTHRDESLPTYSDVGVTTHFKLNDLSFQERNGIQYSFFEYSEGENYGFLRFAPSVHKKKALTANYRLKFLMLSGQLHFHINGKDVLARAGEFVIIGEDSKYSIKNGEAISLIFMIKVSNPVGQQQQISRITKQTTSTIDTIDIDYTLDK